jgi:sirohydrochlorin ferrochelatase
VKRALVILDHGSRRPEAHEHLLWLADRVRERAPDLRVEVAHLEQAEPSLDQALARCARAGATHVAIHPLFLAPGRHLARDVPRLLERARETHGGIEIELLPSLGTREALADLILATLDPS